MPGLADGQGIAAAVLDGLEAQCELRSKGLSPVDESTQEQDTPKCLWPWTSPCQSMVHLEASVAVVMSVLQQVFL